MVQLPDPKPPLPTGARNTGPETPVTMERAFAFGWKAGWGFIAAQIVFAFFVFLAWQFLFTKHFP